MKEENQTDYALLPPDGDGERNHSNNNEDDLESPLVGGSKIPLKESYPEVMLVALAAFSAYAAFVVLQHKLADVFFKDTVLTKDALEVAKREFQHACSFNYIGNMVFRIGHNFVLGCLSPRQRVYFALGAIGTAMSIITFLVIIFEYHWIGFIYMAYFMGGCGIGTISPNLLSCITPLGHDTKVWAISGMPVGFNLISIGGFAAQALGAPLISLYIFVCALIFLAGFIFFTRVPHIPMKNNSVTVTDFITNLKKWNEWFPKIKFNGLALMIDMYCVSFFSAALLYIYNDSQPGVGKVPLFGEGTYLVSHDWFFAITNCLTFAGDTVSRKYAYWAKPRSPLLYLLLSIIGAAACLSKIAILAPLGMFCVFFANGAIYGTSTRYIDNAVDKRYNLIALSIWLFIGDLGSVTGSNTYEYIIAGLCTNHGKHICVHKTA